jgi:hypothetical protein
MSTTQQEHPLRAAMRTFVQVWLPGLAVALVVIPEIVRIVQEEAGAALPENLRLILAGVATAAAVVSAILARIMAIPAVDALLERILSLGSAPSAAPRHVSPSRQKLDD